jgi:hypothetical protein
MKDHALGSEEFLIGFYDLLKSQLATCTPLPTSPCPEELPTRVELSSNSTSHRSSATTSPARLASLGSQTDDVLDTADEDKDESRQPMDQGLSAHNRLGQQTYIS